MDRGHTDFLDADKKNDNNVQKKRPKVDPSQATKRLKRSNFGIVIHPSPMINNEHIVPSIAIPPHLEWFDMDEIHQLEQDALPEFFQSSGPRTSSKTPEIYKEYRDFIINTYQQNPSQYLTVTACRRSLSGDACSIFRVHDFLEQVGLINYAVNPDIHGTFPHPPPVPLPPESAQQYLNVDPQIKPDPLTLSDDSRKKEIDHWTEEETSRLLEGIELFGENWSKISEHIGTKNKEQCLLHFLKLPIEENYSKGNFYFKETESVKESNQQTSVNNPIMNLLVFLRETVSPSVASVASKTVFQTYLNSKPDTSMEKEEDEELLKLRSAAAASIGVATLKATLLAEREDREIQKLVNELMETQLKKLDKKMSYYEVLENERQKIFRELLEENAKRM